MVARNGLLSTNLTALPGKWPGRTESASSAVPVVGGSLYAVNDKLTLVGGGGVQVASVFNVDAVSTGAVTAVSLDIPGNYNSGIPVDPVVTTTGGAGSGCTLSVAFFPRLFKKALKSLNKDVSVRVNDPPALDPAQIGGVITFVNARNPVNPVAWDGLIQNRTTAAFDFFEKFHIVPRSFAFGNVLATQNAAIEIYSAFRKKSHSWINFVNNAGAGVTLLGAPTLSHLFAPQTAGGLTLTLEVSTSGAAFIDTTLDFIFSVPQTTSVPISLERIVLWNMDPETPYQEQLVFLTDIIRHKDGSEQRISPRKKPRQIFEWDFVLDDGPERSRLENILFEWQSRAFGIAMWHEMTRTNTPTLIGATTINVLSTDFADYRITGSNLIMIYQSQTVFDILPLISLTANTLTLGTPTINSYSPGVIVTPLRTAFAKRLVRGSRFAKNAATMRMRFSVIDNDVNISSSSAFSTFNSKVLLDGLNGIKSKMSEIFEKQITVVDGNTGLIEQTSSWNRGRRNSFKTFLLSGKQQIWETRQLIHALQGKQISFYLPTFADDINLDTDISAGSPGLNIVHIGYTQFVKSRQPKNVIMITFNNGDPTLLRTIVSSSVVDSTRENLILDATMPNAVTMAQVEKISYVEKVRFDSDTITIVYQEGGRSVKITAPVKTVLE